MKKNYSDTICDKNKRFLTAKAYKFKYRIIDIVAKKRGLTRYHSEFKPVKEQINNLIDHLLIDKEFSIDEVKEVIKKSICPEIETLILEN